MTTQQVKLAVLAMASLLVLSGPSRAEQALSTPVDPKLKAAYQHLHFDRLYPADAVSFIQGKLQNAPRAVDVLVDLASDQRPDVRVLVATLLGELGEPDGAKTLWHLTRDDVEFVRTTAAGSLVRLSTMTPIVNSWEGLKDPRPDVRKFTAALLGQASDKSAEPALIEDIRDPDVSVRAEVVGSLGACGTSASVPSLVESLRDDSALVRTAAASSLAHFDDPSSIPPLIAALNDSDWHVRASAIMSLSSLANDKERVAKIIDPIAARLQDDPYALVRDRAADALARPNDEKAVAALVQAIVSENREARFHAHEAIISCKAVAALPQLARHVHDANRDVREKIVRIFGEIGGSDQVPYVTDALNDSDPVVRLAAVQALRKLQGAGMLESLESKCSDADPNVRAESARALGTIGDRKAVSNLVELLRGDDNGFVRSAAAESLGRLGDRTATAFLIQVLTGEKPHPAQSSGQDGLVISAQPGALPEIAKLKLVEEKIIATKALGDIRDPVAVDALIESGLKAEDPGLRAESAVSLGKIAEPRAVLPLEATVRPYYDSAPDDSQGVTISSGQQVDETARIRKEKESRVRASVAWALGQIADPSAQEILRRAMNDENSLVRDAAAEALAKIIEKQERVAERQAATPSAH